ncbi:hypothetical protein [Phenylobacterium deserti]|uniref:Uncharacterized protein n=1 Tax=Phenylobacterium deserti TaxID=1914756 RepID=A0A328ABN7_9CAUL|nr:hypothetical protein [Phenylobacterium deserti]RAK52060.1 hypothetical protein DJ018_12955 [Phenylobacterium deserti]
MSESALEQERSVGPTETEKALGPIRVSLHSSTQLFSSIDPSPFVERNLDHAAERFIVNWARTLPRRSPFELELRLFEAPTSHDACEREIHEAVHLHFTRRADYMTRELHELLRRGRRSLVIGVVFITACLLSSNAATRLFPGAVGAVISEGLKVAGWVAMWQPVNVFLYGWWPITGERRLFRRLSKMKVHVRAPGQGAAR